MKKKFILLFLVLLSGILYGALRWETFIQTYEDPQNFTQLTAGDMRIVLRRMIAHEPFDRVLGYLRFVYPAEGPQTHGIGHILGEEAYRVYKERAFGLCDPIFNFGCYHGVVDMAIRTKGLMVSLPRELFDACRATLKDPSPCIHPLGHAAAIVSRYDAIAAFRICDGLYPDPKVALSCWNGVMMEDINRSSPSAPKDPYGDPNNPYFPCDTFPSKYEASCVGMHVSYLQSIWGFDFRRLTGYCQHYSADETVHQCLDALGALAAQTYFSSTSDIIGACAWSGDKTPLCIDGAVVPLVSAHHNDAATALCQSLQDPAEVRICTERIISIAAITKPSVR